ncbi:MAG: FAD-dependent thymidylate synthase [Clostridium sp.]|jgi:thymidylate synthase (FAD)|nr:FAD-dependent thymidylate synthase [Clostridium sp.]
MDKVGSVKILSHTPDPDKICAASARISTTEGSAFQIYDDAKDPEKNGRLIRKVISSGHKSTVEHICFHIAFNQVSVYVEQFLIEFRLASFTVKSRRYVDFRNMGYVKPEFRGGSGEKPQNGAVLGRRYAEHMEYLFREYEAFVERGIPKEDARFLLPYSYRSNFYCTVNARELGNIIYSMVGGRGKESAELRELGNELWNQAKSICPYIFEDLNALENGAEDKQDRIRALLGGRKAGRSDPEGSGLTEGTAPTGGGTAPMGGAVPEGGAEWKEGIELLQCPRDPDGLVAFSALLNYGNLPTADLRRLSEDRSVVKELAAIVVHDRRKRELEQIHFTFRINGISLAAVTHIVRHRMQSVMIPSYAQVCDPRRFLIPDTVKSDPELLERYTQAFARTAKLRGEFASSGVGRYELVYLCLSGNLVDVMTTMNARELYVFIGLRACKRSQWEIRRIAVNMLAMLREVSPEVFRHFGPRCFTEGKCPEGKMTCGQMGQVKEEFASAKS